MLRILKDRYRPIFCSETFYCKHQNLFSEWNQLFKDLSSTEKVQAWVVSLSLLRRPCDWFGGLRKQEFINNSEVPVSHPIFLHQLEGLHSPLKIPLRFKSLDLLQVANQIQIKALPEAAMRSLVFLGNKKYHLEILNSIPTPTELLNFQLKGSRVISFNEHFESWGQTLYHGRDFLSFMIHDLIHGDHFFSTPEHRSGQLGFYLCMQMLLQNEDLKTLLRNSNFKEAFEYIISDMNSHPVHLFKTLHARVQQFVENELLVNLLWGGWTSVWSSKDSTVISALQKINTQLFSDKDAITITEWCIALGQTCD